MHRDSLRLDAASRQPYVLNMRFASSVAAVLGALLGSTAALPGLAQDRDPGDGPLAIPADTPVPQPLPPADQRRPAGDIEYRPSTSAPKPGSRGGAPSDQSRFIHFDAGYRINWSPSGLAPIRQNVGGWGNRPHLIHGTVAGMLDKKIYAGASFEHALNRGAGSFPLVVDARIGWWDHLLGKPERRGAFGTLPGMAVTYVGLRWVHDHFRGIGGEWAGTADAGGLVLGYLRAAPFGKLTVVSDSQFSLYVLGWKERGTFPLGLLNQRISIGLDPVFIDARFRVDPALGEEYSVGLSLQAIF